MEAPLVLVLVHGLFVVAAVALAGIGRIQHFVWVGRLPRRIGALPRESVPAHRAPRGWKCAQLVLSPDRATVRLAGISLGCAYRVDDAAVCVRGRRHDPPALDCECGFYAFRDRDDAIGLLASRVGFSERVVQVVCEVELAATVVEYDRGFRGGAQRVLDVRVLPWCAPCAARGDLAAAALLGAAERTGQDGSWPSVPRPGIEGDFSPGWARLEPLCEACAARRRLAAPVLDLVDVAGRLGTEIRWLDRHEVRSQRVLALHR